jgi:hypothetical protein
MKKISVSLIVLFSVFGLHAEWKTNKVAGIKVDVPANWKEKKNGPVLELMAPGGNLVIHMEVVQDGAADDKIRAALKKIERFHNQVVITSKTIPEIQNVNDLTIEYVEGTGITKKTNKSADWAIAAATNLKTLIITIMGTDGAQAQYKEEIKNTLTSFQKL